MTVSGKQIRVARAGLGIKLKELAAAARVSPTTLNKIENGANAYENTLLRLRHELERRGAGFRVQAGMSWVSFPDDQGYTISDAAHQAPVSAMTGRDAHNDHRNFEVLVQQMIQTAEGLSRNIATLSQKLDAFSSRKRVLLVGRIEEMDNLVEGLGREYEVFLANSAETAYELAGMNAFDLVLCDFVLPCRRDGLWLCQQLQRDGSTAKRVLMADEVIEGWDRCQQDGVIDRFLVKPVQVVDLDGLWGEGRAMSGIPFHQTPMGHAFITKTAPQAVRELGRLAEGIERLNALLEQFLAAQQREPEAEPDGKEDSQ